MTKKKLKKRSNFVYSNVYCTQLTKPPAKTGDYQLDGAESFYICGLTEKPCIAREISDETQSFDVFHYGRPNIDTEKLITCPAYNLPMNIAKEILKFRVKKEISELEKKSLS